MENISWLKQTSDKPLFPDVLWSRPENKRYAGKLLIIGGHSQSFSAASRAFTAASAAGAGQVRVVLPDALQKSIGKLFVEAEFAPSTPIGSFGRQALDSLLDLAAWSDAVLLAGDFGKNSETQVLLEAFVDKYSGLLCVAGDSLDYFTQRSDQITKRGDTLLVGDLSSIQKLAQPNVAIQQTADLVQILNKLSIFTSGIKASVVTTASSKIIVAVGDKVSTTAAKDNRVEPELAVYVSVWYMQQPGKPIESLTSAIFDYLN